MKISREWLQTFFDASLPEAQALADALTFHAFEIESVDPIRKPSASNGAGGDVVDWVLDVKVTPNRGHDALSHRSIAKELSAIRKLPMKSDPLREAVSLEAMIGAISVSIEDSKLCARYIAGYIRGVKVGPSPEWLRQALETVGQKSINNVVDATNFVMFNIGQPLHAFDADKVKGGIVVRLQKNGERLDLLRTTTQIRGGMIADSRRAVIGGRALVIADDSGPIALAGIKGGDSTRISNNTTNLILEAANFNGVIVRKIAKYFDTRTDASDRFQQVISPELAAYGMRAAADLIVQLAEGEIVGFVDEYPAPQKPMRVSVATSKVNKVLGTALRDADVADAFTRLSLPYEQKGSEFVVSVPFERLDLTIPEDLIEEVARIVGYDKIPSTELPPFPKKPEINANFYGAEKAREELMSKGYSEVFTSVFAEKGERAVANKVGGEKPYLRTTLVDGLRDAYERNDRTKDLLGLAEVKIFEIGTVWKDGKETVMIGTADSGGVREVPLESESADAYANLATSVTERYEPFSRYPFIVRDIAMWMPEDPDGVSKVLAIFANEAGMLLRHVHLFDQFNKDGRASYAFRLVLQSFEKTLTDEEANAVMQRVYAAVKAQGWEVR